MTQRTSSIPEVTDRLEDRFTEALATFGRTGDPVAVQQGDHWKYAPQEGVTIGEATGQNEWATFGPTRDEQYTIAVRVVVSDNGDLTFKDAKQRAFDILGVLEQVVRDDSTIGFDGTDYDLLEVQVGTITAGSPADSGPTEASWQYVISQKFDVHAIF